MTAAAHAGGKEPKRHGLRRRCRTDASGARSERHQRLSVHWERLVVISYATLVGPQSNIIDVGGKKGRHVAVFLDRLSGPGLRL